MVGASFLVSNSRVNYFTVNIACALLRSQLSR